MKKKVYITTPIYYVNAEPHVGSAYTTLFADILSRFYNLDDYEVKFLTGTDEHGQKIEQEATKNNEKPIDFVNKVSKKFQDLIDLMKYEPTNFDFIKTNFIRTTNEIHKKFVQDVWRKLIENDWIYLGKYSGWYCISDEAYYDESELIKGEDGKYRTDLGKIAEWREEDTYFFRLSEFQDILLKIYERFPKLIQPEGKKGEIISFVSGLTLKEYENGVEPKKNYLKDLSVSRNSFEWGIKIPVDCDKKELLNVDGNWKENLKKNEKHVIYVWFDALFNYLTSLGCDKYDDYKNFWINNNKKIHLVGKDILRPHSVYWPTFLLAYNYSRNEIKNINIDDFEKYLPTTIYAHGWLTNEGQKISKSLGNVIIPKNEIDWLKNTFSLDIDIVRDYLKYYLIVLTPFGNDGDYSRNKLIEKINADLVNKLGNLIKRSLDMIYKNFDATIPIVNNYDKIFVDSINEYENLINNFDFISYIERIIKIVEDTNKYFDEKQPWVLKKENKIEEMKVVLYSVVNTIRKIAILFQPIIPYLSSQILISIGEKDKINFDKINDDIKNNKIDEPKIIFPRLQLK